ncbi:MAG: hypothetical protein QOG58_4216 [Caballeronia sp.]|jgi:hypothetical protein|nr:hypothetical protein [Caballeronia sp.]
MDTCLTIGTVTERGRSRMDHALIGPRQTMRDRNRCYNRPPNRAAAGRLVELSVFLCGKLKTANVGRWSYAPRGPS